LTPRTDLESVRTKLFYGFGSVAYGVKDQGFTTFLLLFYNQIMGLPAQWVGTAIGIALIVDAFADPVVGQFSDNLRTRWGRRHPLMYASAVPVAVSYWFLWNPPHWGKEALFGYLIAITIIVRTFIAMYEIPSSALAAELTRDYDQRTSFLSYRYLFGWLGALSMAVLALRVFLTPDATHKIGQLNPIGYSHYALVAAIVMVIAIVVSAAGTHRHIPHFAVPVRRKLTAAQFAREMFVSLWHGPFIALMSAAFLMYVCIGLLTSLGIYFQTYFWGLDNNQVSDLSIVVIFAPFIAFALSTPLSRRFGKKAVALALFVGALLFYALPFALRLMGLFPENGSPALLPMLLGFTLLTTTFYIGCTILLASMLTDVVEDSQLRTGRRSEGLFFSFNSLVQKAVSGMGVFIAGLLLGLVHFPQNASPATLDPAIPRHLALVFLPTLLALSMSAFTCLTFYRINRSTHEENVRRLEEKDIV
jgi:Na+/melibiose symporter-like transporter